MIYSKGVQIMNKILCFGDSNVYGFNPETAKRYDENTRWTGLLQKKVQDIAILIEAGCNNRTAFSDNPMGIEYTGYKILTKYLTDDLTTIILAVGINDTQKKYKITKQIIMDGMRNMIFNCRQYSPNAQIILISPNEITNHILDSNFSTLFNEVSIEKSTWFSAIYKQIADDYKCTFINLNDYVSTSEIDGLHYNSQQHKIIAEVLYKCIVGIES